MDIQPRHLAEHLVDAYFCPEDQSAGCVGCDNESHCWQDVHDAGICWKVLNEKCPICEEGEG